MNAFIKKLESYQRNNLVIHLKLLKKQEQSKLKRSRCKEIINIRGEINEMETKRTIQRINETKNWFFENINKTDTNPQPN
jgi:hypothetical protein